MNYVSACISTKKLLEGIVEYHLLWDLFLETKMDNINVFVEKNEMDQESKTEKSNYSHAK